MFIKRILYLLLIMLFLSGCDYYYSNYQPSEKCLEGVVYYINYVQGGNVLSPKIVRNGDNFNYVGCEK